MRRSAASLGARSRSSLIVLLLVASFVVMAVLAAEANSAARSHRAMAEKVLRDYAALAADEFGRRSAMEIGFNGYYFVITALRDPASAPDSGPLPSPRSLAEHVGEETKRALPLAKTFFRFDPADDRLETTGVELDPDTEGWLRETLRARGAKPLAQGRRYETRYARIGGALHGFVTAPLAAPPGGRARLVGFVVDPRSVAGALRRALERAPLLPPSLGGDAIARDAVSVSFLDPFGGEVFAAGAAFPRVLAAEKTLGAENNGVLERFVVRAAVDPAAAPRLAIGGLPRSRVPGLLALLALTAGLMVTAVFQLRRERALDRLRSDFVSRVSHELRTPLTQIRMFAETLLLDRVRSDEERRRALVIIDRETRRLSQLVENILRFSRGERGENRIAPRPHDLGALVRELLDQFQPLADARGARLAARLPDRAVAVVDDGALRQIVLNLLDNAVKYGPRGQEVRVGVEIGGGNDDGNGNGGGGGGGGGGDGRRGGTGGARLWVEDEGSGVSPADQERIWRPFTRLEADRDSAADGTGIGLAVVRSLVVLHGGRCWVEPGERRGARFVVELPASPAPFLEPFTEASSNAAPAPAPSAGHASPAPADPGALAPPLANPRAGADERSVSSGSIPLGGAPSGRDR